MNRLKTVMLFMLVSALNMFAVNLTVVVDNPDAITPTYYDSNYNVQTRTLDGTTTVFDVEAGKTQSFYANNGYVIKTCKKGNDQSVTVYDSGRYVQLSVSEETTLVFTTASDASLRDESFTLNIDDPSAVKVTRADCILYGLKAGDNTVRFDKWEDENEIRITSPVFNMPLVDVLVNGVSKGAGKTSYTLYVNDNDRVQVIAKADVQEKLNVTLKANDSGYFTAVKLDDADVQLTFDDGVARFEAEAGQRLTVTGNQEDYRLDEIRVDGTPYSATPATYAVTLTSDIDLSFKVTKYENFTAEITVDDPTNITVTQGAIYSATALTLTAGAQSVTFNNREASSAQLNISANTDCRITSVTVDGVAQTPDFAGRYIVTLTAGCKVAVVSEKIIRDKTLVIYRDDTGLIDSFSVRLADGTYKYGFYNGYTTLAYAESDLPISISWESEDIDEGTGVAYLDDELLSPAVAGRDRYEIAPSDGSVLKIFHLGAPAMHDVTFDIEKEAGEVAVMRDVVVPVTDFSAPLSLQAGTRIEITPADPSLVEGVMIGDEVLKPNTAGTYTITVTAPCTIAVVGKDSGTIVPTGEWKSIGIGRAMGGLFGVYDMVDHRVYEVVIEQNVENPDWYRTQLINEHSAVSSVMGAPAAEYLCFNVADPTKVYFEEVGFYGSIYFFSQVCAENGWTVSDEYPAIYATMKDNVITWPQSAIYAYDNNSGDWYTALDAPDMVIALPGGEIEEPWEYLGVGKSLEANVTKWFFKTPVERDVDIYESTLPGKKGYYLIEKMFYDDFGSTARFIVDATDPEFVIIPRQPSGINDPSVIDPTYGSPYYMSRSYYYVTWLDYTKESYLASEFAEFNITLKDGRISIPWGEHSPYGSTMMYFPASQSYLRDPYGTDGYILLPGAAISSAETDDANDAAPVEYYNLQGIRVAEPTQGIYIMRCGDKTTKIVK